jgi:glutathione S-transferase
MVCNLRWIEYLEHCLASAADGGASFFFSDRLTYVDLVVYNAVTAAQVQFPAAWPALAAANPKLVAHRERIAALPKIAAYLASDRCRAWAGDSMM